MPAPHLSLPGTLVFVTQATYRRYPLFQERWSAELLLANLRQTRTTHPFQMRAYVIMLDHFHLMIQCGETVVPCAVMASLKSNFSKDFKAHQHLSGRVELWQRGWWEHIVCDDQDFERHLHYIHYNPVHHGVAAHPEDWSFSSFGEWKKRGAYPDGWGWSFEEELGWLQQANADASAWGESG